LQLSRAARPAIDRAVDTVQFRVMTSDAQTLEGDVAAAPPASGAEAAPAAPVLSSLVGLTRAELGAALSAAGVPDRSLRMRVSQLWHWIYLRGAGDFAEMTNVSKALRQDLAACHTLERPEIVSEQISNDGTRKWLVRLAAHSAREHRPQVECVYIPETSRGTLCISSQVGCTLACTFCHTGTQKLVRNLTSAEIVAQVMLARDRLGEWGTDTDRQITNVVLMGMGEPLYNFDNVKAAVEVISDNEGICLSKRRITLSTAGVVPMIERCGEEIGVMLAISLHAVRDEVRDLLVPLNKKYPLDQLLAACRAYPGLANSRRITFEYVMLKGVNDSLEDARALVQLLKGIPAKINLIPFNPWPGSNYECSEWEQIERFGEVVNRAGYASPIRTPRGRDIMAACGQLKSASERIRASAVAASA
jgi:23S rRNA (adenine2503-C2)-methyltransferase